MPHALIDRPRALSWLSRWKDRDVIKVVTGLRRCGKSTVFELFRNRLKSEGVPDGSIISIDLERMTFDVPATAQELFDLVVGMISAPRSYVFIDEAQRVPCFEHAVDALYARGDVDLYITGSNSDMLSSEIATLLTGRYVELRLLPLSFSEYRSAFPPSESDEGLFNRFLVYGGLPYVTALPQEDTADYLDGVLSTILVKDVSLRHPRFDMMAVRSVVAYIADTVGSYASLRSIAHALSRNGKKVSPTTVGEYVNALVESYILFRAKPYDVKGKALLDHGGKYYLGDLGFRHLLLGKDRSDLGHRVENVVYLELIRRYRHVFVGKLEGGEIDFVAESDEGRHYYQVSLTVLDERTLERELSSLRSVPDNYPKTLLTLDRVGTSDHGGIRQRNLIDWLLDDGSNRGHS